MEPLDLDLNDLDAAAAKKASDLISVPSPDSKPPATSPPDDLLDHSPSSPSAVGPSSFLQAANALTHAGQIARTAGSLTKAVGKFVKEDEEERMGQLKDRFIALDNMARNMSSTTGKVGGGNNLPQSGKGDEALPEIDENEGRPPEIVYNHDVVIDMAGYHQREESDQTVTGDDGAEFRLRAS